MATGSCCFARLSPRWVRWCSPPSTTLPPEAHAELATITAEIEAALAAAVSYQRINYLMLMMVDPHVHFHVIPRYEGEREWGELSVTDAGWSGPPALGQAVALTSAQIEAVAQWLKGVWPS